MKPVPLTLGEGQTPLIPSRTIGPRSGIPQLFFKLETVNPTGSYKDRFAVAAVNEMVRRGQTRAIASSSGNAGAALAAYCAAAGIECQIAVVIGAPESKLKQMQAYGAQLCKIEGFGLDPEITQQTMQTLREWGQAPEACLQITTYCHSPLGMKGVEAIGHELISQSRDWDFPLEHVFVCAGGGGLTLAVARGIQTGVIRAQLERGPAVHCVQPEGNNTIAGPLRHGKTAAQSCISTTQITGLQVASVLDGNEVIAACRESGGTGHLVDEARVYELQAALAREEGIFCEPAGAVALAGAMQAVERGEIPPEDAIVCLVTGSGFKDQQSLDRMVATATCPILSLSEFQAMGMEKGAYQS